LYFPWSYVAPSYWNLDFVKASKGMGWGRFLRTYTLLTRRAPRGINVESEIAQALDGTIEGVLLAVTHRMATDRMATDRMATDRMATDRMSAARNYIHSMRNPPNVFFPDECIRKRHSSLATQEMLRLR
jgi:hypothetical protein